MSRLQRTGHFHTDKTVTDNHQLLRIHLRNQRVGWRSERASDRLPGISSGCGTPRSRSAAGQTSPASSTSVCSCAFSCTTSPAATPPGPAHPVSAAGASSMAILPEGQITQRGAIVRASLSRSIRAIRPLKPSSRSVRSHCPPRSRESRTALHHRPPARRRHRLRIDQHAARSMRTG